MKIIIFGGDGFCGWPTSLHLAALGHEILIVDNLVRRKIDDELGSGSLTKISSISDRVKVANDLVGKIEFRLLDVAQDPDALRELIREYQPDAVVQFAEQRAAPYSMIGDVQRRYTVDNNTSGTHNICSALVDEKPDCHLVHLGTMGVYGYSKEFGDIPEGYLGVQIKETKEDVEILYPANPGSIYHMTKCLDQLIFQFYSKNWGLRVTDLHQGIVWGVNTGQTLKDPALTNRFDYDGIYGTVLNRFLSQAANGYPLTVYGTGGQTRAFIHISDTAKCVELAITAQKPEKKRVRIFNQVAEVRSVLELAELVSGIYSVDYQLVSNPRNELPENQLSVSNKGLVNLGFEPITLSQGLLDDVNIIAQSSRELFNEENVLNSPLWS